MKTVTKTSAKQDVLTSGDVRRMIAEAVAKGWSEVDLACRTIRSIKLCGCNVPVSLDLHRAVILGDVYISSVQFAGDFIDFDDAEVRGTISIQLFDGNELSLSMRRASVAGAKLSGCAVHLSRISLSWLCIGGLRVGKGLKQIETTDVRLDGRISFEPNAGIHAD